jgi:hypothetical protein
MIVVSCMELRLMRSDSEAMRLRIHVGPQSRGTLTQSSLAFERWPDFIQTNCFPLRKIDCVSNARMLIEFLITK